MTKDWLADWMAKLADEVSVVEVEGYDEVDAKAGQGPEVWLTIKGAAEDTTTARKVREKVEKIMRASIEKHSYGVVGLKPLVRSYNKEGQDLLIRCTILFP